jgi:hypothetical protein
MKTPNVDISIFADGMNITVLSASVDVAVDKLNRSIALLNPWFRK